MHPSDDVDLCVLPINPLIEAANKKTGVYFIGVLIMGLFQMKFKNSLLMQ